MISRIRLVTVYVSDQEKALDFFVGKLGFKKKADQSFGPGTRWLEVVPPGAETAITLFQVPAGDSRLGTNAGMVLTCDDIEATYREMEAKGVRFTEPPTKQPWGAMQALFTDPDSNGYVLVDRP